MQEPDLYSVYRLFESQSPDDCRFWTQTARECRGNVCFLIPEDKPFFSVEALCELTGLDRDQLPYLIYNVPYPLPDQAALERHLIFYINRLCADAVRFMAAQP